MKFFLLLSCVAAGLFLTNGCIDPPNVPGQNNTKRITEGSFDNDIYDSDGRIILDGNTGRYKKDLRDFSDLMKHFDRSGIKVYYNGLIPEYAMASEACRLLIDERYIGFYKYDVTLRKQRARLEQIKKDKELYIMGMPFKAHVNGAFVMIDAESHEKGEEIINAFRRFN